MSSSIQRVNNTFAAAVKPEVAPADVVALAVLPNTRERRHFSAGDVNRWSDEERARWDFYCSCCEGKTPLVHKRESVNGERSAHWSVTNDGWHPNPECAQYDVFKAFLKTGKVVPAANSNQQIILPPEFLDNLNLLEQFLAGCRGAKIPFDDLLVKDGRREIPFSFIYMSDLQSLVDSGLKRRDASLKAPQSFMLEISPEMSTFAPTVHDPDTWSLVLKLGEVSYNKDMFPVFVKLTIPAQEMQDLFHGGKIAEGDKIRVRVTLREGVGDAVAQIRAYNANARWLPTSSKRVFFEATLASLADVARTYRAYAMPGETPKIVELPDLNQFELDLQL